MTQPTLFDPIRADAEKVWGMGLAAERRGELLGIVQEYLASLARLRRDRIVTADDGYAFLERSHFNLGALGNAAGSLFRGKEWQCVGWVKSTRVSNHARMIRRWRLK